VVVVKGEEMFNFLISSCNVFGNDKITILCHPLGLTWKAHISTEKCVREIG